MSCNPCDPIDEREAAGVPVTPSEPALIVEQLRGLSRLIADREIAALTREVNAVMEAFRHYFHCSDSANRRIALDTGDYSIVSVAPVAEKPGQYRVTLDLHAFLPKAAEKAIANRKPERVGNALKGFLTRAEALADEVEQLRNDVR